MGCYRHPQYAVVCNVVLAPLRNSIDEGLNGYSLKSFDRHIVTIAFRAEYRHTPSSLRVDESMIWRVVHFDLPSSPFLDFLLS